MKSLKENIWKNYEILYSANKNEQFPIKMHEVWANIIIYTIINPIDIVELETHDIFEEHRV